MKKKSIAIIVLMILCISGGINAVGQKANKKAPAAQAVVKKGAPAAKVTPKKAAPVKKKETLSKEEMTKRQKTAQKEIVETKKKIAENNKSIKKNLDDLNIISSEIEVGKKHIGIMTHQIDSLNKKIGRLQTEITKNTKELERIRENYLASLKKMRLSKGKTSALAFLFASENFNQALRRMRYLREFSRWRDKQTDIINKKVGQLKYEKDLLAQSKTDKNKVLSNRQNAQRVLEGQQTEQQALVAELKRNGEALNTHLRKKQAEANDLNNRIAAFIAEEQRKAEQKRQAEEARKRKEQERQRLAKEEAERKRLQSEEAERNRQLALAKEKERKAAEAAATKPKTIEQPATKEPPKKQEEVNNTVAANSADYAKARRRKPRTASPATKEKEQLAVNTKIEKNKTLEVSGSSGGFESAKGSLPRPVMGPFKVTNPFGRHALPDLPNVVYDNPGIDAQVTKGANAIAVYEGKVSGIYVLPGYNNVIIVNHGNYYTIYGNIATPTVKVGDKVKQGQAVGKIAVDEDDKNHSTLHFEVWRNREKLNPQSWIR